MILCKLMEFLLDKPGVAVIAMGDFCMVIDRELDRFPLGTQTGTAVDNQLSQFMGEAGLKDIWRAQNPEAQRYSCFSKTHSTLFRINLVLGNEERLFVVKNVSYMPRGLSDHSPVTVSVELGESNCPRELKISPFWMELIGEPAEVLTTLREFVDINRGTASEEVVWDTLKAFLSRYNDIASVKKNGLRNRKR